MLTDLHRSQEKACQASHVKVLDQSHRTEGASRFLTNVG